MEGSQSGYSLLDNNGAFLRNWFPCFKAKVLLKSTSKKLTLNEWNKKLRRIILM